MKTTIFGCLILASVAFCYGQVLKESDNSGAKYRNKIDDIKTVADIDKLLDSIDKKRFDVFIVKESLEFKNQECNDLLAIFKLKPWSKADFDNNGYTDLLVIGNNYGHSAIVILDTGKNNFVVKNLTRSHFQDCTFPVVQNIEGQTLIVNNTPRRFLEDYPDFESFKNANTTAQKIGSIFLIYKFGDFVELSNAANTYNIEKIEYKTSGCYGTCPSFELSIDSNRNGIYKPVAFNKKKKGTFKGSIKNLEFNELVGLLTYIDFPKLKDDYSVSWTDDQRSFLKITYDGGKVKTVSDYGLIGTFGLSRVYEILFDLRENQTWN